MKSRFWRLGHIIGCLLAVLLLLSVSGMSEKPVPQVCPESEGLMQCGDQCVNIRVDSNNCGECGNACAAGEVCRGGSCVDSPCQRDCNDNNPCTNDFCVRGQCVNEPKVCADGTCCPGSGCVDLSNDPNNCGECGKICTTGSCIGGKCCPVAMDDYYETSMASPLVIPAPGVLTNDEKDPGQTLRVVSVSMLVPASGKIFMESNGAFEYKPYPDFHGETSFNYKVISDEGCYSTATVTINVVGSN